MNADWITRRRVLQGAAATGLLLALPSPRRPPAEVSLEERLRQVLGGKVPVKAKVRLEIPEIAEDGTFVPIEVVVDSPMTATRHVRSITVVVDRNPDPLIFTAQLSPALGVAALSTRIRMRESSRVRVYALQSTGELLMAESSVQVTQGGC